jgi:magnesium chelatase subunit I
VLSYYGISLQIVFGPITIYPDEVEMIPETPDSKTHAAGMVIGNHMHETQPTVHSLRELIDLVSGRHIRPASSAEDVGLAENLPFPFLGLVGQLEMKIGLMLTLINPLIGGVLLVGPRGTGKTTAVRSLLDLLPEVNRSTCYYGCTPEDIESGGTDAVCPDCAKKYGLGEPLAKPDRVRLIELPLNARLDDVIGGLDERAMTHERLRVKRGILGQADQNILYVDEVNLLHNDIVDALLDAAAQGAYTVRRGQVGATYRARITLVGSMNPEEGSLRPQIMDRFGLRVVVRGLPGQSERLEAYQRVSAYRATPRGVISQFADNTSLARDELQAARQLLANTRLPDTVAYQGIHLIQALQIDSLRAEITLFEAAKAYAASDGRLEVDTNDLRIVAPMALRLRRSTFMTKYFEERQAEDQELMKVLGEILPNNQGGNNAQRKNKSSRKNSNNPGR